jgi:DNA topoisomerase-1
MAERSGKFGPFLGCTGYPKCRTIVSVEGEGRAAVTEAHGTGVKCPKDGGDIVARRTRKGGVFYGCANYPACGFSTWNKPVGRECPSCGWPLGEQTFRGRKTGVTKCANADCDFQERAEPAPDMPPEGEEPPS